MSDTTIPYELFYAFIPGRGEPIRLALEEAGAEYTDLASKPDEEAMQIINSYRCGAGGLPASDAINVPMFAPPMLRHGDVMISQLPNILMYLGPRLGLVPRLDDDPAALFRVSSLAMTALDGLCNEVHDCHHPIGSGLYYEDQIPEAKRRSEYWVKDRLPKYLGYFERVLESKASGPGPWLYGGELSYADLVLFQCLHGTKFQFPKAMAKAEKSGSYTKLFALFDAVKERPRIKSYLESNRRKTYSIGIYRYYQELDFEG